MATSSVSKKTSRTDIAGSYLERVRDDLVRAQRQRKHYIHLARELGMTFGQIGYHLGITERAVRGLYERSFK